jgi:hypothetical protein
MGLAVLGAPAGRAQSRLAAGEARSGSETSTTSATSASATPAASSPADLDHRIEALEMELSELKTELAAKKDAETAAASAVVAVPAQDAAKPPEKVTVASLLGPTSVSGFVDTYYQVNFNHPNTGAPTFDTGANFRAFDSRSKAISLGMIELILDKAPDPMGGAAGRTGYHVSLGFGDAMNVVNNTDPAGLGFAQYLKEAYFSYLAPIGSGLQFDVGKFVTSMGAEVIESKDNWNYSRGLLFTYAIPYYHFGVRAKYTFNPKYNLTGFVVNGWNNVVDNNSGKTYGFSFNSNPTKTFTYTINYLAGPEENNAAFGPTTSDGTAFVNVNSAWRQTWDAEATYTPNSKWAFMANFDYGRGDRVAILGTDTIPAPLTAPVKWWGGAGYVKYSPDANDYFAARYEYFADPDGFTATSSIPGFNAPIPAIPNPQGYPYDYLSSGFFNAAGNINNLHFNEITATYQRTLASCLLTRFEYRRDMANYAVYSIGNFGPGVKQQNTGSISLIFLFDSRNAK